MLRLIHVKASSGVSEREAHLGVNSACAANECFSLWAYGHGALVLI